MHEHELHEIRGGTDFEKKRKQVCKAARLQETNAMGRQTNGGVFRRTVPGFKVTSYLGGGNYFSDVLKPSKGFIVWDKRCYDSMRNDFADCEYAWLSDGLGVARMFRYIWNGMIRADQKNKEERFHPTQKPIALYKWILKNYAKPGYKILDTHVGSGSSLIACYELGFDYVGFEIDEEYYKKAVDRIERAKSQIRFDINELLTQ